MDDLRDRRYTEHKLWAAVIVAEHVMLMGKLLIEKSFAKVPNRVHRCAAAAIIHHPPLHPIYARVLVSEVVAFLSFAQR